MHNQEGKKKIIAKVFIGILNVAFAYGFVMLLTGIVVFSWFANGGPSVVPEQRPTWVLAMLPFFSFGLVMISCAIIDLTMMVKLKRNPSNEKLRNIRKKWRNVLLISFIVLILFCTIELLVFLLK